MWSLLVCVELNCIWVWENVIHNPFVESPKIADNSHSVVFFGIINVGLAHLEYAHHCNAPKLNSLWISFLVISMCFLGNGNGCPWYGFAPSLICKETNLQSQLPSVPSNGSSNSWRSSHNDFFLGDLSLTSSGARRLESSQCIATLGWLFFNVNLSVKMKHYKPWWSTICFIVEKQNYVRLYTVLVCSH